MRLRIAASALLLLALACGRGEAPLPEPDPTSERSLTTGRVVGFHDADEDAQVWRGLPFALPPVGELRWRAPRPPEPWEGLREATSFGKACAQVAGMLSGDDDEGGVAGSEDCLVANVFAPRFEPGALPRGEARLPVMVWIHGGGNSIGSADVYDFARFAVAQQAVVIAVHYRLGVFGWFRHPALHSAGASAADRSGNYGTLDLIRALEWVRDNAAAFGGDPKRVTVFGESAGGINVFSLLLSPRAKGLFQGAISQSGLLVTSRVVEAEHYRDAAEPGHRWSSREILLALLEQRGAEDRRDAIVQAEALDAAESAALLRDATPAELLGVFDADGLGGMYQVPFLIRDGSVLPAGDPLQVFERAEHNRVPVILGTNRDENKLFLLFTDRSVRRLFGVPLWLADARRYELLAGYQSRMWRALGADEPALALAAAQPDVYAYRFDWDEQPSVLFADYSVLLGASHAMEIPFVMGHLDLGFANRFLFDEERRPAAEELSAAMMSYWGAFGERGRPGRGRGESLPLWEAWQPAPAEAPKYLVLDTPADGGIRMASEVVTSERLLAEVPRDERIESPRERCEVYASFVLWSTRLSEADYAALEEGACREFPVADFAPEGF